MMMSKLWKKKVEETFEAYIVVAFVEEKKKGYFCDLMELEKEKTLEVVWFEHNKLSINNSQNLFFFKNFLRSKKK